MPAIWTRSPNGWQLVDPSGFPDEAALHELVAQAPEMLPLAGSPRLALLGREVRLGSGRADLLAVEPDGRVVVIEIKLARNAEARRAVVAQVLAYAAFLHGYDGESLAREVLATHLSEAGASSIAELVQRTMQEAEFDAERFCAGLDRSVATGAFRLVIVLDSAPNDLVELAGFLGMVTRDRLLVDLVVVSAYEVAGVPVMVPQRVDPERPDVEERPSPSSGVARAGPSRSVEPGAEAWFEIARELRPQDEPTIARLERWAATIKDERLADLGKGSTSLLVRLRPEAAGLVAFYVTEAKVFGQFYRSSIERRAPNLLPEIERLVGREIGQGTGMPAVSDELLAALLNAYRATH